KIKGYPSFVYTAKRKAYPAEFVLDDQILGLPKVDDVRSFV
ncbi:hypothetical protein C5167_015183, partial [Papaver somniferum]